MPDSTRAAKTPLFTLPREHGFWVMLAAVVLSSSGTSNWQAFSIGAALLSGLTAILVAAAIHKRIRRLEWAQLASSPTLALLIAPAELIAGVPPLVVLGKVVAWASLFTGSSLAVRSAFARSSRRKERGNSALLSALSVLSPAIVAGALYLLDENSAMRVAVVGSVGLTLVAIWRPTAKSLKATGMTLALIVACALAAELLG